ncbi:MAG: hypothetical protein ACPGVU_12565 [Limisphaerales bacterium]
MTDLFVRELFNVRIWFGIQIFIGVFFYNLAYWLIQRIEDYAGEAQFFCLGRVAIWLLTWACFDTLLRICRVSELDRLWIPVFMITAIPFYALAVKTVAADRGFIRHPRVHELGVVGIAIGVQMLPELIRLVALDFWTEHRKLIWYCALAASGYIHYLLINWLQSTADAEIHDGRRNNSTGND